MSTTFASRERQQTPGEEIANSLSHGAGLLAAIVAAPVLIGITAARGEALAMVGAAVFVTTVILLYAASTIYHAIPHRYEATKSVFQIVDHGAIYLLIAGTYTPFTLGPLSGVWGWTLLVLVWSMALVGVLLKGLGRTGHPWMAAGLYLAMGWIVIIAIKPVIENLPPVGLIWLVAGGAAYTLGIVFFLLDNKLRFAHFIWHLFVLAGTACHFVAVILATV